MVAEAFSLTLYNERMKTLAIIGGGAAGLAASVRAGELARERGEALRIVVYEADDRVGRPILRTGNGRCNFTNAEIYASDYRNAPFVMDAFDALEGELSFGEGAIIEFFSNWGLVWKEEGEGRRYPASGKATTVLNVLRAAMEQLGVEERCDCRIERIEEPRKVGAPFTLRIKGGEFQRADAVIVACGGTVARDILSVELPFVEQSPVLGPLEARLQLPEASSDRGKKAKKPDANMLLNLNNIRVECAVRLMRNEEEVAFQQGELLFRKYGVSGIAVFNLSRFAAPGDQLLVDLLPGVADEDMGTWLFSRRKRIASRFDAVTWEVMLRGLVLPPVAQLICALAQVNPGKPFAKQDVAALAAVLKNVPLEVLGIHDAEGQCQVHRGGFAVSAFDPASCQAKDVPGLYVVGEALDIDAPCGGYNLHWAWTSGILAAQSVVGSYRNKCVARLDI